MRLMLYEAARVMLVRLAKWSWLKALAMKIAKQRGMKKAIVALARRLAVRPPEKHDTVPRRQISWRGDAMADWLAFGLEDAYADQPETGVIRRRRTV